MINIAADRATNPHAGAFAERQPSVVAPCQIITGGEGEQLYTIMHDFDLTGAYRVAPLTQRGWVFQERMLSPRVVHLGMEQLWWECTDIGFASEFLPTGLLRDHPQFALGHVPFKIVEPVEKPTAGVNSSCTTLSMTDKWHSMVVHYSSLTLNFPEKDVFAALSGVAERYAALLDDEYIAGHFLSMMPQDLCWISFGLERSRTLSYRAPTWSWTSVSQSRDNLVWFRPDQSTKALASIVSHKVELLDQENPCGPIRYAEITLSALLLDCFRLDGHPAIRQHDKVLDDSELECVVDFNPGDPLAPMLNPKRTDQKSSPPTWGLSKVVSEVTNPALFKDMPTDLSFLTPEIPIYPEKKK
ncbi:heterokaryon incompatibility protein [Macrophomina phaseolina MS6]|uniref:Heterokaryon incompatibility protein n=1 Tax=Macrophomina phaseolina (strain MS6) TaxID=1126212 RepID=K2RIG7_MACPH|nr:heterokaryon incompatibility protein [Macrophomina phaseolina MS6]